MPLRCRHRRKIHQLEEGPIRIEARDDLATADLFTSPESNAGDPIISDHDLVDLYTGYDLDAGRSRPVRQLPDQGARIPRNADLLARYADRLPELLGP